MCLTKSKQLTRLRKLTILVSLIGGLAIPVQASDMGFVVSHIEFALPKGADTAITCPDGMNQSYKNRAEGFIGVPTGIKREPDESEQDFRRRMGRLIYQSDEIKNLCENPELASANPTFHEVSGKNIKTYGIDIDGENSQNAGVCAHSDFVGENGETGVDNQFYRVFGCVNGFQPTGQANSFATEMLTGSWGILIKVTDVDDNQNDDSVKVGIYANADPIQLSPTREPLEYASYAIHMAPRFHAETTGKIVNGVLTTEPVEVRFPSIVNAMYLDRILLDARLQATIDDEGKLDGYLSGYSPVENVYDENIGFRNAKGADGEPSPRRRRIGSAFGKAMVMGYTCEGVYHSLYKNADGHPDPETGKCTSISTQFRVQAIPAFVMEPATDTDVE